MKSFHRLFCLIVVFAYSLVAQTSENPLVDARLRQVATPELAKHLGVDKLSLLELNGVEPPNDLEYQFGLVDQKARLLIYQYHVFDVHSNHQAFRNVFSNWSYPQARLAAVGNRSAIVSAENLKTVFELTEKVMEENPADGTVSYGLGALNHFIFSRNLGTKADKEKLFALLKIVAGDESTYPSGFQVAVHAIDRLGRKSDLSHSEKKALLAAGEEVPQKKGFELEAWNFLIERVPFWLQTTDNENVISIAFSAFSQDLATHIDDPSVRSQAITVMQNVLSRNSHKAAIESVLMQVCFPTFKDHMDELDVLVEFITPIAEGEREVSSRAKHFANRFLTTRKIAKQKSLKSKDEKEAESPLKGLAQLDRVKSTMQAVHRRKLLREIRQQRELLQYFGGHVATLKRRLNEVEESDLSKAEKEKQRKEILEGYQPPLETIASYVYNSRYAGIQFKGEELDQTAALMRDLVVIYGTDASPSFIANLGFDPPTNEDEVGENEKLLLALMKSKEQSVKNRFYAARALQVIDETKGFLEMKRIVMAEIAKRPTKEKIDELGEASAIRKFRSAQSYLWTDVARLKEPKRSQFFDEAMMQTFLDWFQAITITRYFPDEIKIAKIVGFEIPKEKKFKKANRTLQPKKEKAPNRQDVLDKYEKISEAILEYQFEQRILFRGVLDALFETQVGSKERKELLEQLVRLNGPMAYELLTYLRLNSLHLVEQGLMEEQLVALERDLLEKHLERFSIERPKEQVRFQRRVFHLDSLSVSPYPIEAIIENVRDELLSELAPFEDSDEDEVEGVDEE